MAVPFIKEKNDFEWIDYLLNLEHVVGVKDKYAVKGRERAAIKDVVYEES